MEVFGMRILETKLNFFFGSGSIERVNKERYFFWLKGVDLMETLKQMLGKFKDT